MTEAASQVQKQYKDGLNYKNQQGYLKDWALYERFRAGDQWPKATQRTKDLPRPVLNVIDQIQSHKISSVMNVNIKMMFSAAESEEGEPEYEAADTFTRFADSTWERIKQDDLNEEALDGCSNTGTCIWHYYWDTGKKGGNKRKYIGEMQGEIIDPVNFFPGNPQERDVQKQPYLIITSRDSIQNVRNIAESNGVSKEMVKLIQPDSDTEDQAYDKAKIELDGSEKVTVLTKYYKKNGTVHFLKVAGDVVIKPEINTQKKLYPLEVMQWKRRKKSIFGVGDTEGLIANQQSINFLIAMQILSVQNTGWPKALVKKDYIKQNITNSPGEVVYHNAPPGEKPFEYANPGNISNHASGLVDNIMAYTKEVSGANQNAMGEHVTSDMNATAIDRLQRAAGIPLESIRRRFYQSMENIGRIWEEFWKNEYNTERMIPLKDDDGEEYIQPFTGSDHKEVDMELKIDIGAATTNAEDIMVNSLNSFLDRQLITFDQYLKYVPDNVVPFKDRLLKEIQEQQEQQMMMQQEQGELAQQQNEEQMLAEQEMQMQNVSNQPHPFDEYLKTIPKHQQDAFRKLPLEEQEAIMEEYLATQQPQI